MSRKTTKRARAAKTPRLTHFDARGRAHMVDVGGKPATQRRAVAEGHIRMQRPTLALIVEGKHKKGDVLGIARIAGIQGAKRTAELIPLCHPIALTAIEIELEPQDASAGIYCRATASTTGPTGVEMEALTAVQVALLTIYDMCKAVDRGMTLNDIRLVEKSGGASSDWKRE